MHGVVRFQGAPVAGAMVQLYDGMTNFTDAAGRYELVGVLDRPFHRELYAGPFHTHRRPGSSRGRAARSASRSASSPTGSWTEPFGCGR
jgi:hypothetical protein